MARYRIYFIDSRGRMRLGEAFDCEDEDQAHAALARAERTELETAELWRGGRLLRRLAPGKSGV
ncbi:MAG: hypothetical protein ACK4YQ_05330 [Phenylobacterium sp.]|uniref:hypothetical protein n=1 Tax=Phenylobacterium sp. TaxID=1871053 RepID=UPI00391D4991